MDAAPNPFEPFLDRQGFVLLDGGLATALEDLGHDLRDPLWSARVLLEAPDDVRAVHRAYLEAGADCIATVTYQATFQGFAARGMNRSQAEGAFRDAVRLAVEARDAFWADPGNRPGRLRPLVAASVGPYGAYLADGSEYRGAYGLERVSLAAWHRDRWRLLAESEVDLLACETIPDRVEAGALLDLLAECPGRWAWMSFQCRDGERLADGTPLAEVVAGCAGAPGLMAVGVNCVPPGRVASLLRCARPATDLPLVAYPNAGEKYDAVTKAWAPGAGTTDLPAAVRAWRDDGARVLGGCCRTGPGIIADLRRALTPS
jgi:homocysteine S-methyltransferase